MFAGLKGVWKLQLKILFNIVGQPCGVICITSASGVISVGQHMELVNCFDSNVVMGKLV